MKKITISIILLLVLSTVTAQQFIPSQGYGDHGEGMYAGVTAFFTRKTSWCGDNTYQATNDGGSSEDCDGSDLNSQTCVTQGFAAGNLSCSTSCTFDTSTCNATTASPGGSGGSPTIIVNASDRPTELVTGLTPLKIDIGESTQRVLLLIVVFAVGILAFSVVYSRRKKLISE